MLRAFGQKIYFDNNENLPNVTAPYSWVLKIVKNIRTFILKWRNQKIQLSKENFGNYRKTRSGKALVEISPIRTKSVFKEVYDRSISDSDITKNSALISWVEEEHEIMSGKGFAIQHFCSIKGDFLNRTCQKNNTVFRS